MSGNALSDDEKAIIDALVDAWDRFVKLGEHHPDDLTEFRHAIHAAQNLIAFRVARRIDPDVWSQPGPSPVDDPD